MGRLLRIAGAIPVLLFFTGLAAHAQVTTQSPQALKKIDVVEHLGEQVPLNLQFLNESGDSVRLGDYFHQGKPVLLSMVYYECPMLCTFVLNGIANGVRELAWTPGQQFQMVSVSIDPRETPELAANKQHRYIKSLDKPAMQNESWAFLVGEAEQSEKLADALGFQYYYDADQDQYAHPAAAYLLTEDGVISRYLYGIEFKERDLRLGLLEASEGKIGTTLEKLLLYCYHFDPQAGSYVLFAENVMRVGGALTLIVLSFFLVSLWMRERLRHT